MARFDYEAKTRDGTVTKGEVRARDRRRAGGILQKRDLFVTRLRPAAPDVTHDAAQPYATPSEVAWQIWQLSMMVETGLALSDSLACLARQARRPRLRSLLEDIARRVREGSSMSAAMEAHRTIFPASLTSLVRAGELSGAFKDVLRKTSQYLMADMKLVRRVRGAMAYPIVMLGICTAVTVFLLTVILPKFAGVFAARHATLPLPTRILMTMSDGLLGNWPLWLTGAGGIAGAALIWARSSIGRRTLDRLVITAPVVAPLFNALFQSRLFTVMALMIESHVPLLDVIRIAQGMTPNSYYRALWREIEEQVRVGERMAVPLLESDFIAESVAQVIDNGDRNGKLGPVFSHLAEFFDEEYKRVLATTMQLIEPCLIVLMGAIVGFVAVSLMLPLVQASRIVSH